MKIRGMIHHLYGLAIVASLQPLSACSLGTEVGNGLKPATPSQPGQPVPSSGGGPSTAPSPQIDGTSSTKAGTDGATPTVATAASAPAATTAPQALLNVIDLALGGCASPLAETQLTAPISYKVTINPTASYVITVQQEVDGKTWDLLDATGIYLRKITPNAPVGTGTYAVSDADANGSQVLIGAQCSTVTSTANVTLAGQSGTVTKRSVTLTDGGGIKQLTWYVAAATNAGSSVQVPRIELSNANSVTTFVSQ